MDSWFLKWIFLQRSVFLFCLWQHLLFSTRSTMCPSYKSKFTSCHYFTVMHVKEHFIDIKQCKIDFVLHICFMFRSVTFKMFLWGFNDLICPREGNHPLLYFIKSFWGDLINELHRFHRWISWKLSRTFCQSDFSYCEMISWKIQYSFILIIMIMYINIIVYWYILTYYANILYLNSKYILFIYTYIGLHHIFTI